MAFRPLYVPQLSSDGLESLLARVQDRKEFILERFRGLNLIKKNACPREPLEPHSNRLTSETDFHGQAAFVVDFIEECSRKSVISAEISNLVALP